MSTTFWACLVTALVIAKADLPDFCKLPPDPGSCNRDLTRYFYDPVSHECKQFTYKGCGGNKNNFKSNQECVESCQKLDDGITQSEKDACQLPSDPGPCCDYVPKYYYSSSTGTCEKFNYGGCLGNDNRFDSQQQCQTSCYPSQDVCCLPAESGPCLAYIESYFYNTSSGKCDMFIYGGCKGNLNRFATEKSCNKKCDNKKFFCTEACKLPAETGTCRGYIPKFHFNSTSGKCELFIYGGCGGNDNKFDSEKECQQKCNNKTEPKSYNFCLLQPETGMCKAYMPSYFYNVTTTNCERFIYGGCGGNDNRFASKEDCQRKCPLGNLPLPKQICLLQPEIGPCDALIPRYYYNVTTRSCNNFIYGGCGGNNNRFKTQETCLERCPDKTTST